MSILKIKDSQGNWVGVPTVKGDTGNGISSAVLNDDYTLTLTFTDGTTYKTPSIRGEKGERGEPATDMDIHICSITEYDSETRIPTITNPDDKTFYLVPTENGTSPDLFTEWVYVNNAWEMFGSASVDLSGYLTDVTVNGTSIVTDGVANIPVGNGIKIANGAVSIAPATNARIKQGIGDYNPIVSATQDKAVFYGLAKASRDTTQSQSSNPVGTYTDEAKASIQTMLDVPSKSDIPEVPVDDVQINGTSIVENSVANVPIGLNKAGAVQVSSNPAYGININSNTGIITVASANDAEIKAGTLGQKPIAPQRQHMSTFYGLAKAAGDTTQSASSNAVGVYTDNAKDSIQNMLGITPLIASHESDPFESNHVVGELFIIGGKLYRAKTALTAGEYINEGTNVEVVNTSDVYVKNTDWATDTTGGIVKVNPNYGIDKYGNQLIIKHALYTHIKEGSGSLAPYRPITPDQQHQSVFYGLAKIAGHDEKDSTLPVGTYTPEAKSAIKQMLSIADNYDSFIVDVEGTDPTITGQPSYRYNCGEVLSLTVTPPETGTIDFRFTSGSSPTVLTLPSTVKMPEWWVEVEANTIYEMCITDGVYCGVMSWAM